MQPSYSLCLFTSALLLTSGAVLAQQPSRPPARHRPPQALATPSDHVPGEVLVKFRDDTPQEARFAARQALGAELVTVFSINRVDHWALPPGLSVERAIGALTRGVASRWIEYAEPNYFLYADQVPADPRLADLWGLHNAGQTGGTVDADIDALEAWQVTTGSAAVVVGVIDTGIDMQHPELAANVWSNPGEIAGNGLDDDGNGYIDDLNGWDFANNDNDPSDDHGHGTHVSGTIGASGNDGVGIAGVSWSVRLMALKFLNAGGSGTTTNAILAIQYAAAKGARITNNSWGGGQKSNALSSAIANSGALFVASAGNNGSSTKSYPAGYDAANILSIAATTSADALASYSNYSSTWVDVAAPGSGILSCQPGGGYQSMDGTSMAAPHVSGLAVLLFAQNPGWSVSQVKSRIMSTADPLAALAGRCVSGARINAKRAVGAPDFASDSVPPEAVLDLAATSNTPHEAQVTLTSPLDLADGGLPGSPFACELRYVSGAVFLESEWNNAWPAATVVLGPAGSPLSFEVPDLVAGETVALAVKSIDVAGNRSAMSNVAVVTTTASVGGWTVKSVDLDTDPFYIDHDYSPQTGQPTVAYDKGSYIVTARWNGADWERENVTAAGGGGLSFAFDPLSGNPTLSEGSGKVSYWTRGASGWTSTVIESKNAGGDVTSLVYNPVTRQPAIAYRYGNTMRYAYRSGSAWIKESADPAAAARYNALAFDAQGNPAVAYCDDYDNDGWLDSLWFARRQGGVWSSQKVSGPVRGYGVHAAIAYDASTDTFVLADSGDSAPHLWRQVGGAWVLERPPGVAAEYVFGVGMNVAADGTAVLAFSNSEEMFAGRRDANGVWSVELIDYEWALPFLTRVRFTPDGRPSVSYDGYGARLSTRDNP